MFGDFNDDNYCLKMNNFQDNIKTCWKDLQVENNFYDITLACENKKILAHKVIITSFSPKIKSIIKLNQNPNPLLYFVNVKYKDLQNLIDFMYQGQVYVAAEDLNTFMEVAEDLEIKGLSKENEKYNLINKKINQKSTQVP